MSAVAWEVYVVRKQDGAFLKHVCLCRTEKEAQDRIKYWSDKFTFCGEYTYWPDQYKYRVWEG